MAKLAQNERRRDELRALTSTLQTDADADGAAVPTGSAAAAAMERELRLLEDEYLALMLQSEDFLLELRHDDDFMSTLQRGQTARTLN